jgi:TPR repeat protein
MRFAVWMATLGALAGGCGERSLGEGRAAGSGSAGSGSASTVVTSELTRQCDAGVAEACRNLGVLYAEGAAVPVDTARARALFGKACDAGNGAGCNNLGLLHAQGEGGPASPTEARAAYQRACDAGSMLGCRNLGILLGGGRGVDADLSGARAALTKACDGKMPLACTTLGSLEASVVEAALAEAGSGSGKPAAPSATSRAAITAWKRGCDGGDPMGCRELGLVYLRGAWGLPRTPGGAAEFLTLACDHGDGPGCRWLGELTIAGDGRPADRAVGLGLVEKACKARDQAACQRLRELNVPGGALGGSGAGSGSAAGRPQ